MGHEGQSVFASASVPRHLIRGALGFGLIGSSFALTASVGPAALLLSVPGLFVLRGCPMCWTIGLIETISAGGFQRSCTNDRCALSANPLPITRSRPPATRSSGEDTVGQPDSAPESHELAHPTPGRIHLAHKALLNSPTIGEQ